MQNWLRGMKCGFYHSYFNKTMIDSKPCSIPLDVSGDDPYCTYVLIGASTASPTLVVKTENYICNIFTLHVGSCIVLLYYLWFMKPLLLKWESAQQGLENGDEKETRPARQRLIINSVFHDSAANREWSVYKTISL